MWQEPLVPGLSSTAAGTSLAPMSDVRAMTPFENPVSADVQLVGSKSYTNRALIIAALARGESLRDLSVSRPSLEDVYLELTAEPTEIASHA